MDESTTPSRPTFAEVTERIRVLTIYKDSVQPVFGSSYGTNPSQIRDQVDQEIIWLMTSRK